MDLYYWIASAIVALGLCNDVGLAMTALTVCRYREAKSHHKRHCEGNVITGAKSCQARSNPVISAYNQHNLATPATTGLPHESPNRPFIHRISPEDFLEGDMVAVFFAVTLSIDALGVGMACGLRDRRPTIFTLAIIFAVSLAVTGAAVIFGNWLFGFFPPEMAEFVGAAWIMLLGLWIFLGALRQKGDGNKSGEGKITILQSISLALMISIDSMGAGLAAAALGLNIAFLPFLAAAFQVLFFSLGVLAAERLPLKKKGTKLPTMVSGIILVTIGIIGLV